MSDLLKGAADSPLLLAFLVILGGCVWAVEKLGGVDGPITRAFRAWQDREVRRLRRQRAAVRERRAVADARVDELESEVAWLREQLDEYRQQPTPPRPRVPPNRGHGLPPDLIPATEPIPRARNSARGRVSDR